MSESKLWAEIDIWLNLNLNSKDFEGLNIYMSMD